jgi:dTDP-4-amino-4,6-dideoxygalactose transaminase
MTVVASRLDKAFLKNQTEYETKALEILRSGWYILGNETSSFENEFAEYIGTKYSVGCASGLDALYLAFRILEIKKGDEIIVSGNTYIASVMGITMNRATPVFAEPDEYYNIDTSKIESLITKRTKAILIVHLYGQTCKMDDVMILAMKYNLKVVEDCAQSHGSKFNSKRTGTFGDISCFSFYPSKNLGAFGDGGAIVTNSEKYSSLCKILRNYGSEKRYYNIEIGINSRLDELQAGLLRVRLKHLDELIEERINLANKYLSSLSSLFFELPRLRNGATHVYHQFVIRCKWRNQLINYLNANGIGTIIHYPIPPHLSEAYAYLGYHIGDFPITELCANEVLSLPMYNGMTEEEQYYVIETLNKFVPKKNG